MRSPVQVPGLLIHCFLQAGSCIQDLLDRGGYTKWPCLGEVPCHLKKKKGKRLCSNPLHCS